MEETTTRQAPQLIQIQTIADILGCSRRTAARWVIASGVAHIAGLRGAGARSKKRLYRRSEVLAALKTEQVA